MLWGKNRKEGFEIGQKWKDGQISGKNGYWEDSFWGWSLKEWMDGWCVM